MHAHTFHFKADMHCLHRSDNVCMYVACNKWPSYCHRTYACTYVGKGSNMYMQYIEPAPSAVSDMIPTQHGFVRCKVSQLIQGVFVSCGFPGTEMELSQ